MIHKHIFKYFVLILSLVLICPNSFSNGSPNPNLGAKTNTRGDIRMVPRSCNNNSGKVLHSRSIQNIQISSVLTDKVRAIQKISPQQVEPSTVYQHQLAGDWDQVVGQIGFFHDFPNTGKAFISIIGLQTFPEANDTYRTVDWERKVFWFDVGDGVPIHLSAEYFDQYEDPEDERFSVLIYSAKNLIYRQNGKDYSQTEFNGEFIDFELLTDIDNNYVDHTILILDENDEVIEERKFEIGDQVQSWTSTFIFDDPDTIWLASMEEDFRTVISEPVFMYEHLTPNVDFPNAITNGLIDFEKIDLQLTLFGINEADEAEIPFQFSSVQDLKVQWDGSITTGIVDWIYHWFE